MSLRRGRWLAVLVCLGLMAGETTVFQLTLSRFRTDWINAAVQQHDLLMGGTAGDPWQYRILSDYAIQLVFDALSAAGARDPFLYGFVLFRGAQEVAIFGLGFLYFRRLGLGLVSSLAGLAVVCGAMLLGQVQSNWRLDTYTDLLLYLAAGYVVLARPLAWVIPITFVAALNRETSAFIPLMPLLCVEVRQWRSARNFGIYRLVAAGVVTFVLVRYGLTVALPGQAMSTRVVTDELIGFFTKDPPFILLAVVVAAVPIVAARGLATCPPFVRRLFWLMVPAWLASHAWGNVAMTTTPFLVPLTLVLVPAAVHLGEKLWCERDFRWADLVSRRETLGALATVHLVGPVVAGIVRVGYPFPLERLESNVLQEVRRIVAGEQPFVAPTLDYVPLLYAPLYFYVSAAVAVVTGPSFMPLRLVSFAAALGSAVLLYRLVSRDAPGRFAGLLAACFFVGTSELNPTERFPARVDNLCVLLLLAATYVLRQADRRSDPSTAPSALAGVLVGLAVLTKQTAVIPALGLLVLTVRSPRSRLLPYSGAVAVTLAIAAWLLASSSAGWAGFYVVDLPRNHGIEWQMALTFWTEELLPRFGAPLVLAAVFFAVRLRRREYRSAWFYALATGSLVGMGWVAILNPGGGANSLPPAFAGLAMLFGLGSHEALRLCSAVLSDTGALGRWSVGPRAAQVGMLLVVSLTLGAVKYTPVPGAPLRANILAGRRLVDAIADLEGPVLAPDLGEFQWQAGKGDQAYATNYRELLGVYGGSMLPEGQQLLRELDQVLASHQYAYVLVDPEGFDPDFPNNLGRHRYVKIGRLLPPDDPFYEWAIGQSSGGGQLTPSPEVYVFRP